VPAAPVVRRYSTAYTRLLSAASRQQRATWVALGGLTDDHARRYVPRAVAASTGAERAAARLVAGFLATTARVVESAAPIRPALDVQRVSGAALRGEAPEDVFMRPVIAMRSAIAQGHTFEEAFETGAQRAATLVEANVALAQRVATVEVLSESNAVGYRRVLGGVGCELCASAAGSVYRTDDLMPIHNHCSCSVAPVYDDEDPGRTVNRELTHEPPGDAETHDHGELGPVLTPPDQEP
jgi:hypothetical protein